MTTVAERPARGSTNERTLQLVAEAQVQVLASARALEKVLATVRTPQEVWTLVKRLTQEMRDQFEAMAQLTKELEEGGRHA